VGYDAWIPMVYKHISWQWLHLEEVGQLSYAISILITYVTGRGGGNDLGLKRHKEQHSEGEQG
jgi:hypothetical protein